MQCADAVAASASLWVVFGSLNFQHDLAALGWLQSLFLLVKGALVNDS